MTIETICNLLLDALTEAGFNESTLFSYKGVIRRFKTFCNENGVTDYTGTLGVRPQKKMVGIKADGTVVALGDNRQGQCNVSGWRDIQLP